MNSIKNLKSKINTAKMLIGNYFYSRKLTEKNSGKFGRLERFCLFIGYPRSGHSLVGSLVDAHENAVISHELDSILYLNYGFGKERLLSLILDNSKKYAREGRENTKSFWLWGINMVIWQREELRKTPNFLKD